MARRPPEKLAEALRANLRRRKGLEGLDGPKDAPSGPAGTGRPASAPSAPKAPQIHKEKPGIPPSRKG